MSATWTVIYILLLAVPCLIAVGLIVLWFDLSSPVAGVVGIIGGSAAVVGGNLLAFRRAVS